MLDTGSTDTSIKPSEFNVIDPDGIIPLHGSMTYELANGEHPVYRLDVGMLSSSGDDLGIWRKQIVAKESDDDVECLSGIDIFQYAYTASNPGIPAAPNDDGVIQPGPYEFRIGNRKKNVHRAVPSGRTT